MSNATRRWPSEQAISQEELDDAIQAKLVAKAAVAADKAAVESARLNLGFYQNHLARWTASPEPPRRKSATWSARARAVLTTVSTVDPMRVYFNISEQSYLAFCRQFTNAAERAADSDGDAIATDSFRRLDLSRPGKWFFTSRQVDVNTGTLQVAGLVPEPRLHPAPRPIRAGAGEDRNAPRSHPACRNAR